MAGKCKAIGTLDETYAGKDIWRLKSFGFKKFFFPKPAYWIDFYFENLSAGKRRYFHVKQWSFRRKKELIEGHTVSEKHSILETGLVAFRRVYLECIGNNWKVCEKFINIDPYVEKERDITEAYFAGLDQRASLKQSTKSSFKTLIEQRKRKGSEW